MRKKRPTDSGKCEINARRPSASRDPAQHPPAPKFNVDATLSTKFARSGVYFARPESHPTLLNIEIGGGGQTCDVLFS